MSVARVDDSRVCRSPESRGSFCRVRTIGEVEAIFRYPIKSMAGERLDAAEVGWSGVAGDRRLALRRLEDTGGKPWLTASKLAELLRYTPTGRDADGLPTHVRLPDGRELPARSEELDGEIARRHGKPVQMMRLEHGIFDEACISVIAQGTIDGLAEACGRPLDIRRFRANLVIRTETPQLFEEDAWVGGILAFGDDGPQISITMRD